MVLLSDIVFTIMHTQTKGNIMICKPKSVQKDDMATKAVQIMEEFSITSLVVTQDQKNIDGIIHLHDILKAGIV